MIGQIRSISIYLRPLVFLAMFNWYFSSDDGQQELEKEIIKKIARKIVKAKADGVLEESIKMD